MPLLNPKVPAPLGGWNTRDPLPAMAPTDAVSMTNLVPGIDGVSVRPGYTLTHTLLGGTNHWVNALIPWKTQYGERLIAASAATAANHSLFDITTSTVSTIKSGYIGSKWRHGVMGGRMALVNGADLPQELTYTPSDGMTVRNLPIGGNTPDKFKRIHIFKSRSYFATGEEPAFWYSEVSALGGTLTRFAIDRVASTSGNVVEISSWTRDGGSGPDDFFVLFLDTGEVIAYQGSNPGDASDWALVGRYKLGRVLSVAQFAGKLHAVTDEDYNILPDDLLTQGLRQPTKLAGAARDAVSKDATDNWSVLFDTSKGWRIINVPAGSKREQHILNLRTGAPFRFDIEAQTWAIYRGELYFGGKGAKVYKMRDGDDNGTAIEYSCQQAYMDLSRPQIKTVLNYRPVWSSQGDFTLSSGLAYDYDPSSFIQTNTEGEFGPVWDTSPWDTSSWGTQQGAKLDWLDGAGEGQTFSLFINGTSTKRAVWQHTDYRVDISTDSL